MRRCRYSRRLWMPSERWNAVLYTIAANLCSWLLGGALLAYLPI